MLLRSDEIGLPCYVETGSLRQLALYRHLGFQILRHATEPASGIEFWTACREPVSPMNPPRG
jgi:hypothetical protein